MLGSMKGIRDTALRLNRAPGGTRIIVCMRERLLDAQPKDRELQQVEDDFHHLLQSWFNPGFLRIARVDWNMPATLLEQLIRHEAVHEIHGWNDLRRRLQDDRRCFAFFHPALPEEPHFCRSRAVTWHARGH